MSRANLMLPPTDRVLVAGRWERPLGAAVRTLVDPATEEGFAEVALGSGADIDLAVEAARSAWMDWSQTTPVERAAVLHRLAGGLESAADWLANLLAREIGAPVGFARAVQVGLALADLREAAAALEGPLAALPRARRSTPESPCEVFLVPAGVVGAVTPWNYPLHQVCAKLGAALAAGCCVVLKPSEVSPLTALALGEVSVEAGLPPGVFNVIVGTGREAGEALAGHPGIDMVSFTGSTRSGGRVAALAAVNITPCALELGGKSASLVLADGDLQRAARTTARSTLLNSGQSCNALTRLIVPRSGCRDAVEAAVDEMAQARFGDPFHPETTHGPLVSAAQRDRVRGFVSRALASGSTAVCGGVEPPAGLSHGWYAAPTVLVDVAPDSEVWRQEVFGPVLCVLPYDTEAEGLALAEGTPYGLAAAVWSGDAQRARSIAARMRVGQVGINRSPWHPAAPFGGMKRSGYGRELGEQGVREFLVPQAVLG